jgi:hypothetical protein
MSGNRLGLLSEVPYSRDRVFYLSNNATKSAVHPAGATSRSSMFLIFLIAVCYSISSPWRYGNLNILIKKLRTEWSGLECSD